MNDLWGESDFLITRNKSQEEQSHFDRFAPVENIQQLCFQGTPRSAQTNTKLKQLGVLSSKESRYPP